MNFSIQKLQVYAHFVHVDRGLLFRERINSVPRVGDEVRIGGRDNEKYFEVVKVVWVFDEDDFSQRVNIGLKDASPLN